MLFTTSFPGKRTNNRASLPIFAYTLSYNYLLIRNRRCFVNEIPSTLSEVGDFFVNFGALEGFGGDWEECVDLTKTGDAGSHRRQMRDSRVQVRAIRILKVGSGDGTRWKRVVSGAWAQRTGPIPKYGPRIRCKLKARESTRRACYGAGVGGHNCSSPQ